MGTKLKTISMLLFVSMFISCGTSTSKEENKATIITVAKVKKGNSEAKKEFPFIAKPFRSSELSFRVSGPINNFEVYAGTSYKKGEVIAEIDARDFIIRKQRAEAVYNQVKAEFERIEVLFKKNNISASSYEKAKSEYTSAKMALETASNELKDTKLIAPFNGYVGEIYIEKFQDVKATQPIISFVDIDQLKIETYVPQEVAFNANQLNGISITFDAMPTQIYSSQVVEVSKSTTKNNLSYLLTALLPNNDKKLLSGMSGKIIIETPTSEEQSFLIPQTALCHRPTEGDYVWVIDNKTMKAEKRKVKVKKLQPNGYVSIASGLNEDETVAISSLRFLSNDMKVEIAQKNF